MKSKKRVHRKTKKGYVKKNTTRIVHRGGVFWSQANWNANQENNNQNNNESWNNAPDPGYRGLKRENGQWNGNQRYHNNRRNRRNRNNGNNQNYDYNADDEETDEDDDDVEQDYENYQDYIEDLTEGLDNKCNSTTLQEKLEAVDLEIEKVADTYNKLVQGIADQTLGEFIDTGILQASYSAELSEWHRGASRRANEFQRISEDDLKRAFQYLLPSFDIANKYYVLNENDEDSSMHVMIKHYAYKMITALFTRSNITYAVIQYDETESDHQFLENLLGVMRCASQISNQYLREDWNTFLEIPMDRTMYVNSGGNMTVMIAGMLCYLYDTWNSGYYQYNTYADTLLDEIRQEFEGKLVAVFGSVDPFYRSLTDLMRGNDEFRNNLKKNTEKISDIDLLFMAPDYFVDNIQTNAYMFQVNELTAYVLRKIMITAHRDDDTQECWNAYHVMPFAGDFDDRWKKFKFSNMSGIREEATAGMHALHEQDYYGYRQSSNRIDDVPMYLNRIKQGYKPFYDLNLSRIPEDLQYEYSNKYGECLDCSIGAKTNPLYNHKQENYMNGNYYTIETLTYELEFILQGPKDDKYNKRLDRYNFLMMVNNQSVNALFQIMGRHIT